MPVSTWGDFEVYHDRLLGRGGMGAVYMGRQVSLDRPAAIKVLKKDLTESPEFVKRFHREAALLARLVDTHVVQVFGAGEADGQHYYAMEYVEGEDLTVRLRKGGKYTIEEVLQVAVNVSLALQAAWKHHIVHRDIKPSNIIVAKDGQIKVMDFGLAKNPEADLTQSEIIMGTAKYMSPEQAGGTPLDIRSDLYSLGVVLYELAAGRPPFTGDSPTSIMYQHVHQVPRPPRDFNAAIPVPLQALILQLLAKTPEERHSSPEAVLKAVNDILDGVTSEEKSTLFKETRVLPSPSAPAAAPESGTRGPAVLAFAALLLLAGAGGYYAFGFYSHELPPPVVTVAPLLKPATPPPPVLPPARPEHEGPRERGLAAFAAGQWAVAVQELEDARRKGAKGVDERIAQALIEQGSEEADEDKALALFDRSKAYLPEDEARSAKMALVSYRKWSRGAEKNEEGGRWEAAAADWKKVIPFAPEAEKQPLEMRRKFCETFAEALREYAEQDWARAAELFRGLSRNPGRYGEPIERRLKEAEAEVEKAARAKMAELQKECETLADKARAAAERAEWAAAKPLVQQASDPRFEGHRKELLGPLLSRVEAGLAAPTGMLYVPAGPFLLGGGRDVEGPEPRMQETKALYLDAREVTVREYDEFLKALASSGGHHPGCPKGEPAKSHEPDGWGTQRRDEPVSNVDWYDAASYAAWRGKRLPREIEWEKAAGWEPGGRRRAYPWGEKFQEAGGKSYLGAEAMGGGVLEWMEDWFQPYPGSAASNSDFGETRKVLRGGSVLAEEAERQTLVTWRHRHPPTWRRATIGFRCAKDAP